MNVLREQLAISHSGDMSQTSIASDPWSMDQMKGFAVQPIWTGSSPVGTITIQGSNDDGGTSGGNPPVITNWTTVSFKDNTGATVSSFSVSGNSGNTMIQDDAQYYRWARLVYTKGSGTGTLSARLEAKGY